MTPVAERSLLGCSPLAQSMALASLREPNSGVYILQDVCWCPAALDAERLRAAWNQLTDRHPALRTSVHMDTNGHASTEVHEGGQHCWREIDWRSLTKQEVDDRLNDLLHQDRHAGFDLKAGVPLRLTLVRTARGDIVILSAHHAILDGRSLLLVWREWFQIYDSPAGELGVETTAPVHANESPEPSNAEPFWRDYLAGLDKMSGFVIDRLKASAPAVTDRYCECRVLTDPDWSQKVREFARSREVSLATLIDAAWAILLNHYSGQDDIAFGITHSGRTPGQESAIGLLINTLPLRVRMDPDIELHLWLKGIRNDLLAVRKYVRSSIEEVMAWAGFPAGLAPFDSVVVYDHEPPEESLRKMGGAWAHRTFRRFQRSAVPLMLAVYGAPSLSLTLAYDTSQYCAATIDAMLQHLKTILTSMCSPESRRICDVEMLTSAEKAIYLERCTKDYGPSQCLHTLFEVQAQTTPDQIALETSEQNISYAELNRRANRIAHMLRERGVQPDDFVAISLPEVCDTITALVGVLKSGAAFLLLDPAMPAERRAEMIRQIAPVAVLDAEMSRGGADANGDIAPTPAANPSNAAYAIFTSGSTGRPKAIIVPHRAIVNQILGIKALYKFRITDRRLQFASLASDVFVSETFSCLSNGATIVIAPNARTSSIQEFNRLLEEKRITLVSMPGSWWNVWAAAVTAGTIRLASTVRTLLVGMEKIDPVVFQQWRRIAGNSVRWFNVYGPAENSPVSTVYQSGTSKWESGAALPIGRPLENTSAYILDESRRLAPPGVMGELYLSGDGLARGYLGDSEQTAERFQNDPFRPGELMYRTGDRAFAMPDGNIVFAGRTDRQLKIRGYRVELDEIEAALARHPSVFECAVAPMGTDGSVKLAAFVASSATEGDLRAHLTRLLPEYMLPAAWVMLERLPHTASGKIDRVALAERELPELAQSTVSVNWTPVEHRLAALWREVLDIPAVDISDEFFRLGGTSLSATRLLVKIQQEFGVELSLASIFEAPALARMAARLDNNAARRRHELIALESRGTLPPFICVGTSAAGVECFRQLAKSLGASQPFYVAPEFTLDLSENAVTPLAEQAAVTIQAAIPNGPYTLGGYCFGGVVAYQTAQILAAGGAAIRMVVLFDSATPGYPKLLASSGNYLRQFARLFRRTSNNGEAANMQQIQEHAAMVGTLLRRKAANRYSPEPAQFPVAQFIAADEAISTRVLKDPRLGWRDLCQEKFYLQYIEGTHGSLFSAECAPRIAALLRALLDPASRTSQASRPGMARWRKLFSRARAALARR